MTYTGTDGADAFGIVQAQIEADGLVIAAGAGMDVVRLDTTSAYVGNLAAIGTLSGVEAIDLSLLSTFSITIENDLVAQSNNRTLELRVGDGAGTVELDVGPLAPKHAVSIEGSRTVQLTGDRDHFVKSNLDGPVHIVGDSGKDLIYGSLMDDVISGGATADALHGRGGDDTIDGGLGNDTMYGGPGSDVYIVDNAQDKIDERGRWAGTDHVVASVSYRIDRAHVETLELVGDAVIGVGNSLQNVITGNDANNILDGNRENDTMIGGLGNDTYFIRAPRDKAVEAADAGVDSVKAFRSYRLDDHVERLYIQNVIGSDGQEVAGINGFGNTENNLIYGNDTANILGGETGRDVLFGRGGADQFRFEHMGRHHHDKIGDFDAGEGDVIALKGSFFGVARGALDADLFHAGRVAAEADDRFVFDADLGRLYYDANGAETGGVQLVAILTNGAEIDAGDILIY